MQVAIDARSVGASAPTSAHAAAKPASSKPRPASARRSLGATATLRYYRTLETPTGATVNAILTGYPDVYLFGCLIEAAIFTQDEFAAQRYLQLYNASVAGLNARTQRITASAAPVIRLRAGMLP